MEKKFVSQGTSKSQKDLTKLSITLSYYLRHGAKKSNLPIDLEGFVPVSNILALKEFKNITAEIIKHIVETDSKQRYQLRQNQANQLLIRAVQGHSIKSLDHDSMLEQIWDPAPFNATNIVHGTFSNVIDEIMATGLKTMSRNHIHFALGYPEDQNQNDLKVISGIRNKCDIFIELDLALALANGIKVYKSPNNVILTEGIMKCLPPIFFKRVYKKENDSKVLIHTNQDLDKLQEKYCHRFLFVLDFEANCSDTEVIKPQEIIEFPVVIVDTIKKEILSKDVFHYYVKPTCTKVTDFCTQLTGITASKVETEGIILQEVLHRFSEFLKDRKDMANDFCFVTCGDWDLNTCLRKEAEYKGLQIPDYFKKYINVKNVFAMVNDKKGKFGMVEMLKELNLPLEGRHHSGIDDSKNIAQIVLRICEQKNIFIPKAYVKIVK